MGRDEVFEVIKKNILEIVEEFDEEDLDPQKTMKDYGATSLDIVEIVSSSMREMKVKVPRSELNKIENIAGLVDSLHKAAMEKVEG